MPIEAFSVAMMTSQQPSSAALPAKQRPETMPTSGTSPDSSAKMWKVVVSSPATPMPSVSPGRPPPPSAKRTTGSRQLLGQLEQPVLLAVVLQALRAGEHGVVVGHGHAARAASAPNSVAVDRADAGDQAVGRGVRRSGRRAIGGGAARRRRARRTRRSCRRRTGRRRSRARCAGRWRGAGDRLRAGAASSVDRVALRGSRRGRAGCGRGRPSSPALPAPRRRSAGLDERRAPRRHQRVARLRPRPSRTTPLAPGDRRRAPSSSLP